MPTLTREVVTGEEGLRTKLRLLDMATQRTVLAQALAAGLAVIHQEASARAPRRTGKLARSIGVEINMAEPTKVEGRVAPEKDAWYGVFAELGTKHHPPQPFLRPALDATEDEVVAAVKGVLGDAIRRAAR